MISLFSVLEVEVNEKSFCVEEPQQLYTIVVFLKHFVEILVYSCLEHTLILPENDTIGFCEFYFEQYDATFHVH